MIFEGNKYILNNNLVVGTCIFFKYFWFSNNRISNHMGGNLFIYIAMNGELFEILQHGTSCETPFYRVSHFKVPEILMRSPSLLSGPKIRKAFFEASNPKNVTSMTPQKNLISKFFHIFPKIFFF